MSCRPHHRRLPVRRGALCAERAARQERSSAIAACAKRRSARSSRRWSACRSRHSSDARGARDVQELRHGGARLLPRLRHAADHSTTCAGPQIDVSIGSLDEPAIAKPTHQYGIEVALSRGSRSFARFPGDDHRRRRAPDATR